jgi:hypothetical protein
MLTAACLSVYTWEQLHIVIYFLRKQVALCNDLLTYSRHKTPISLGMQTVGRFTAHVCMERNVMSTQNAKQAVWCVTFDAGLKFKFGDGVARYKIIS